MSNQNLTGTALDIVTLGRAGVDLYGQQFGGRLEEMHSFAKYVGGCPANIAVGSARLGLKSAIFTRVGADHMGRFLLEEFASNGVSVEGITTDPERLTALVLLGIRDRDTFPLVFYRENCADMALTENDIDPAIIARARAVLLTGTHLSTESTRAATQKAIVLAKEHGSMVVLDVDYRPVLWGLTSMDAGENRFVADAAVTERLQEVASQCDLIVGTEEEFHILSGTTDTLAGLRQLRQITDAELVCKLGPQGCVVFTGEIPASMDDGESGPGFPTEVMNVLGAGDAFLSGYLSGWLRGASTAESCRRANACGSIVVSRHGCAPAMPTAEELDYFLNNGADAHLDQLHWSTTRRDRGEALYAFAIDHRLPLMELLAEYGESEAKAREAKQLAYQAFNKVAQQRTGYGMLLDGDLGETPLHAMSDCTDYWIGRPIEKPASRPLAFSSSADVATELSTWPSNHVVKCLVSYHPDDDPQLKRAQDERVLQLFDACRKTGHELLLEIIASKVGTVDEHTVAGVIAHFYSLGVYPDWWKLEPMDSDAAWANICATISRHDAHCRGVVVLGLAVPCEQLLQSFSSAAKFDLIKGFAVGRSIFEPPLRKWLAGEWDETTTIDAMADNYRLLVDGWREAKQRAQTS